jgi:hypothetical protein
MRSTIWPLYLKVAISHQYPLDKKHVGPTNGVERIPEPAEN